MTPTERAELCRRARYHADAVQPHSYSGTEQLLRDLASECERLAGENETLRKEGLRQMAGWVDASKTVVTQHDKITKLEADNARLREALEAIRDHPTKWYGAGEVSHKALDPIDIRGMANNALSALAQGKDTP